MTLLDIGRYTVAYYIRQGRFGRGSSNAASDRVPCRTERPAISTVYLSPARKYLALVSLDYFCFFLTIWHGKEGATAQSDRWIELSTQVYSAGPATSLLAGRAGVALALYLAFLNVATLPVIAFRPASNFFDNDGSLNSYAQGILLGLLAWTGVLVALSLLYSLVGARQHGGIRVLCGLSKASEENKTRWTDWQERLLARVRDSYELCQVHSPPGLRRSGLVELYDQTSLPPHASLLYSGVRCFAARRNSTAGIRAVQQGARRAGEIVRSAALRMSGDFPLRFFSEEPSAPKSRSRPSLERIRIEEVIGRSTAVDPVTSPEVGVLTLEHNSVRHRRSASIPIGHAC